MKISFQNKWVSTCHSPSYTFFLSASVCSEARKKPATCWWGWISAKHHFPRFSVLVPFFANFFLALCSFNLSMCFSVLFPIHCFPIHSLCLLGFSFTSEIFFLRLFSKLRWLPEHGQVLGFYLCHFQTLLCFHSCVFLKYFVISYAFFLLFPYRWWLLALLLCLFFICLLLWHQFLAYFTLFLSVSTYLYLPASSLTCSHPMSSFFSLKVICYIPGWKYIKVWLTVRDKGCGLPDVLFDLIWSLTRSILRLLLVCVH